MKNSLNFQGHSYNVQSPVQKQSSLLSNSQSQIRKSSHLSYEDQLAEPISKPAFVYNSSHVRDIDELRFDIQDLKTIKKDFRRVEENKEEEEVKRPASKQMPLINIPSPLIQLSFNHRPLEDSWEEFDIDEDIAELEDEEGE
jgi:hypothetical protein